MAFVDFETAFRLLNSKDVVAIPTETVYGLGGKIDDEDALKKIFSTKKRPFFDPLIVHLSLDMSPTDYSTDWPPIYSLLVQKFWPGPLTLIAPKKSIVSDLITAGLTEVGLRCPNHPLTQKLIAKLGVPLAAPSANLFGQTSPTEAKHVESEFSGSVAVLDGGPCEIGLESTVVRYDFLKKELQILRPGFISITELKKVCNAESVSVVSAQSPVSPGQLKHHYQPKAPLVLIYINRPNLGISPDQIHEFEKKLGVSESQPITLNLSGAPEQIARRLYADLRHYSQTEKALLIAQIEITKKQDPNWSMIIDRLEKASTLVLQPSAAHF